MKNALLLEHADIHELAKQINEKELSLDHEQVLWLIEKQSSVFNFLTYQTLKDIHFTDYLKDKDVLLKLAKQVDNEFPCYQIIKQYVHEHKSELKDIYFEKQGALLHFLNTEDYQPLVESWLDNAMQKKFFAIPAPIMPFAKNRHLKYYAQAGFNPVLANPEELDADIATKLIQDSYRAQEVYRVLPAHLQDNAQVALALCEKSKQHYFVLTQHVQAEPRVLRHVMEDILYPQHDNDSFRPDTTAVKPKQIPEHVLQAMPVNSFSVGLAVRILQAQPHLIKKTTIQEKWLNSPEFNNEMPKIYRHLGQEEQHIVLEKILHGNSHDLYSFLQDNPAMFKTVLAKQTTEQKLDLLLIYEQVNANLHEHLQKMNLSTDFLRTHVEQFIKSFIEDTPSHYDEARIDVWKWIGQNMGEQAEKLQLRVLKSAMSTHNILYKAKTHLNKTELLGFIVQIEKIIQDNEAANPELLEERLKEEQRKERYNQALIKKLNSFKR